VLSPADNARSHARSRRSWSSIKSRHSPMSTRKFSWFDSAWYRYLERPGDKTRTLTPSSENGVSSPSKKQAAPNASFVFPGRVPEIDDKPAVRSRWEAGGRLDKLGFLDRLDTSRS